jgi:hypothetical protein
MPRVRRGSRSPMDGGSDTMSVFYKHAPDILGTLVALP